MRNRYIDGEYHEQNPSWHSEDSAWKAQKVANLVRRHQLRLQTVCEVGSGAGEILRCLHDELDPSIQYVGYEISPQAYELSRPKQTARLRFELRELTQEPAAMCDLMLIMDVLEHVENEFEFLRNLGNKSRHTILHVPLDLSAQAVLRETPLTRVRKRVGHVHYFTKELLLSLLQETGYHVIDHCYTCGSLELPSRSPATWIARLPRRLALATRSDWAVRLLGGFSLLVLARTEGAASEVGPQTPGPRVGRTREGG